MRISKQNVEVARRAVEAFDRGRLGLSVAEWDAECEWVPAMAGIVESKVYRGQAGLRLYFDELFESFSEVRVEEGEYRDLGDQVLVLYRLRVRGRDSGLLLDQPGAILYELRAGKIVRGHSYLTHNQALKAVGLI